MLKNQVIDTVWFVLSFNESLNEVTQTFEMDICLRFWNKGNMLKIDIGGPSF